MGKVTVDQILAEAKTLSRDEQEHLWDTLDTWLRSERPEAQLERLLYDAGLLRDIRPVGPAYSGGPVRRSGPMLHSPRQHLPVGTEDLVKGFSGVLQ